MFTVTVPIARIDNTPMVGRAVSVRLKSGAGVIGGRIVSGTAKQITDVAGEVVFTLTEGFAYEILSEAIGVAIPVSGNTGGDVNLADVIRGMIAPGEQNAATVQIVADLSLPDGQASEAVPFTIALQQAPAVFGGKILDPTPYTVATDSTGRATFTVPKGPKYRVISPAFGDIVVVVDTDTAVFIGNPAVGFGGRPLATSSGAQLLLSVQTIRLAAELAKQFPQSMPGVSLTTSSGKPLVTSSGKRIILGR